MTDLDDLVFISQYAGRDVLLVQGGGGNTSVKSADGQRMWIKASGLRLAQVRHDGGYLEIDVSTLVALLDDRTVATLPRRSAHEAAVTRTQAATLNSAGARPSLETTFHAVLGRVVLHTHPVYVNAFTCMVGGTAALDEAMGGQPAWVPYATPGIELGRAVAEVEHARRAQVGLSPASLALANHGFIAAAESAVDAVTATDYFVALGQRYFGLLPDEACASGFVPPALAAWAKDLAAALSVHYAMPPEVLCVCPARRRTLLVAANDPERWLLAGPLVPDDVVYGGHRVWSADPARSPEAWLDEAPEAWPQTGRLIIALCGLGVVLAGPSAAFIEAMEENLLAHVLVRQLIARRGVARPLPPSEIDYLLSMESEKYRQRMAAQP